MTLDRNDTLRIHKLDITRRDFVGGTMLSAGAMLHLMLANERTRYFEATMAKEAYEFGMKNGNLLDRGRVVAPEGPGLGIEVDWDHLATADFYSCVFFQGNSSITASVALSHCPQLDARGDMK